MRNGQCFCPKGTERKQTGTYAYECVKPPPPITCKGGSVKDGVCYCPKGTRAQADRQVRLRLREDGAPADPVRAVDDPA